MPITPINLTKHAITLGTTRKSGYAFWDDSVVTWDSPLYFWDSPTSMFATNLVKHAITPINQVKN